MKARFLFTAMLFAVAGVQNVCAQQMLVNLKSGEAVRYETSDVESVTFIEEEWVDLGLPSGTLWARCNVGANSPEEFGDWFAWGETSMKTRYDWTTYAYCNGSETTLTKYCSDAGYGTVDNRTELEPMDDAATVNMGQGWKMPTEAQMAELINAGNTTHEWTQQKGVSGYKITSKRNGKSIFLPAAGYYSSTSHLTDYNDYWTSTRSGKTSARELCFQTTSSFGLSDLRRQNGASVRAVRYIEEHEYVDLGLPSGTLWATCNVGASKPEGYGSYFAWGETEPRDTYDWSTYKWCNGSYNTMTKYCIRSSYGYKDFSDGKAELDAADDAATANWGSGWQMPSLDQLTELYNSSYTTMVWTTQGGVNGRLITSKVNGNSIFLPAAGRRDGTRLYNAGSIGYYWSRSLYTGGSDDAYNLGFNSGDVDWSGSSRCTGQSVRPVRVK